MHQYVACLGQKLQETANRSNAEMTRAGQEGQHIRGTSSEELVETTSSNMVPGSHGEIYHFQVLLHKLFAVLIQ